MEQTLNTSDVLEKGFSTSDIYHSLNTVNGNSTIHGKYLITHLMVDSVFITYIYSSDQTRPKHQSRPQKAEDLSFFLPICKPAPCIIQNFQQQFKGLLLKLGFAFYVCSGSAWGLLWVCHSGLEADPKRTQKADPGMGIWLGSAFIILLGQVWSVTVHTFKNMVLIIYSFHFYTHTFSTCHWQIKDRHIYIWAKYGSDYLFISFLHTHTVPLAKGWTYIYVRAKLIKK